MPESLCSTEGRRAAVRSGEPRRRAAALLAGALLWLAPAAAAQGGSDADAAGFALEGGAGVGLPSGGLAGFAEPGFSGGVGVAIPVAPNVSVRLDGGVDLPDRDVAAAPLLDVYTALGGVEYVARQEEPGRAPLRTALGVGAGVSLVEAAEMPAGAPAGAEFSETYFTLSAGARLGYRVSPGVVLYVAPGVRWFDFPAADADRLTAGLGVAPPEYGWMVPLRAGARLSL